MTITTAMLMAAGLGTRMRPLTNHCPKPLIDVANRTLIDRTLDNLVAAGITKAIINVHYLADMLEAHLAKRDDLDIILSDERDELLETGGGVAKALPHLGDDPVIICNTDAFWLPDDNATLGQLTTSFDPTQMDSLLLLAKIENTMGYHGAGDFGLTPENRLIRRGDNPSAPFVFAGAYILNPQTVKHYEVRPFSANQYWNESLNKGRLYGQVMSPFWMHVGDPDARDEAERLILENRV